MPSMFTVVSWLPVPLVEQVTGPRAMTVNIGLTVACLLFSHEVYKVCDTDSAVFKKSRRKKSIAIVEATTS